jgi:hypothetical protein
MKIKKDLKEILEKNFNEIVEVHKNSYYDIYKNYNKLKLINYLNYYYYHEHEIAWLQCLLNRKLEQFEIEYFVKKFNKKIIKFFYN